MKYFSFEAKVSKELFANYSCTGINTQLSNATFKPGAPIPVKINDPGVQRAARFGVYKYNNMSNDIFLFKESHINKATRQVRTVESSWQQIL